MAIEFTRDDEESSHSVSPASGGGHTELREAFPVAIRSTILLVLIGTVLLVLGTLAMKRPIVAASSLLRQTSGAYWYAWMPTILFGFYGIVFGGAVGWRTSSASGLTGALAWAVGASATLLLVVAAVVAAALIFPSPIPILFWVAIGLMAGGSLLGVSVFAFWVD